MKRREIRDMLRTWDRAGRRIFTLSDFSKILEGRTERTLDNILHTLTDEGMLERPARGIYIYSDSQQSRANIVDEIARTMRRGHHVYSSLESALSEHGIISQIPLGHHTYVTTGRKGLFRTDHGVIEFTHTSRDPADFTGELLQVGRALPLASWRLALRDLNRVGRNTHLIQQEVIAELELCEQQLQSGGHDSETCNAPSL